MSNDDLKGYSKFFIRSQGALDMTELELSVLQHPIMCSEGSGLMIKTIVAVFFLTLMNRYVAMYGCDSCGGYTDRMLQESVLESFKRTRPVRRSQRQKDRATRVAKTCGSSILFADSASYTKT